MCIRDRDEEAHQKEEYEPKEMKMPETKSASQLAAEAIAKAKEEDQMKLEAEKRAERLMEEARKRGKDPMEFALHQQEILNYMEKNSDELVSFEDYEDLSPEEKLEIEKELYREKQIEAGVDQMCIRDSRYNALSWNTHLYQPVLLKNVLPAPLIYSAS